MLDLGPQQRPSSSCPLPLSTRGLMWLLGMTVIDTRMSVRCTGALYAPREMNVVCKCSQQKTSEILSTIKCTLLFFSNITTCLRSNIHKCERVGWDLIVSDFSNNR